MSEDEYFSDDSEDQSLTREEVMKSLEEKTSIVERLKLLPPEVKEKVVSQMNTDGISGIRVRNDKISSFIAVFLLCMKGSLTFDPYLLATELDMCKADINRALKIISGNDKMKMPPLVISVSIFEPDILIPTFLYNKNIKVEDVKIIRDKCVKFYNKYRTFLCSLDPKLIMAYTIKKHYLEDKEPPLDKVPGHNIQIFSTGKLIDIQTIVLNDLSDEMINKKSEENFKLSTSSFLEEE